MLHNNPRGGPSTVCCRVGDEPLFPGAQGFCYTWDDLPNDKKKWSTARSNDHKDYMKALCSRLRADFESPTLISPPRRFDADLRKGNFVPRPQHAFDFPEDAYPEVLLAPRHRKHGAHRNYEHWPEVCAGVQGFASVGLLGTAEASLDLGGVATEHKVWNHADNLTATLNFLKHCRLCVTTDSAMAHLAVLCGAPLAVIYDEPGREAGHPTWPWAFDHMKHHAIAHCEPILYAWGSPDTVVDAVQRHLNEEQ